MVVSGSGTGVVRIANTLRRAAEPAIWFVGLLLIWEGLVRSLDVPVFVLPLFLQKASLLSPLAWGLNGALDVFLRNAGVVEVIPDVARLLGSFVITILGALLYRKLRQDQRA